MCYSATFGGRAGRAKGKQSKTSKSKKKNKKCSICNEKGHGEDECPDKLVAGRPQNSGGTGSGISHKSSRKANSAKQLEEPPEEKPLELPAGFVMASEMTDSNTDTENPFFLYDTGCDIGATLDTLSSMKLSKTATPTSTYQKSLESSETSFGYGGCMCRQLLKPGKPWKKDAPRNKQLKEADPRAFFVLGLGPRFFIQDDEDSDSEEDSEDEDEDENDSEGVEALTDAIGHDDLVVGVFARLDYTQDLLELPGYDKETQLRRFRATCKAALQTNVPIQCRIAPAPIASKEKVEECDEGEGQDDPYIAVVRDLAKVLNEMSPDGSDDSKPQLKIHLCSWNGKAEHMSTLLQAFPETLYVGLNASVGFTKSILAHECAFDIKLNRLLLETDAPFVIPSGVAASMGRMAFCHSGLIPFCAAAVAEQKKNQHDHGNTIDATYVARIASKNAVRLYGGGVALRDQEATSYAAEMLLKASEKKQEEVAAAQLLVEEDGGIQPEEQDEEGATANVVKPVVLSETKKEKKKKKKKKKRGQATEDRPQEHDGNDVEAQFDDELLATMLDNHL